MPDDQGVLVISDKDEFERLNAVVHTAKSAAGKQLWLAGESLRQIRDRELWVAGGFSSFTDYLDREAATGRQFSYKLMKVAEQFNVLIAERYGIDKLNAVVAYINLTEVEERAGDALAADIRIRDESGQFAVVPLHTATTEQIRAASKLVRDDKARERLPAPSVVQAAKRIADRLPKVKGVSAARRVRVKRGDQGRPMVSFVDIPIDEIEAFVAIVKEEWGDE